MIYALIVTLVLIGFIMWWMMDELCCNLRKMNRTLEDIHRDIITDKTEIDIRSRK